jgi:hypothetical protein
MILIAGQIEGLSTRKDKTIRLTLGTQELSPNEVAELFKFNQSFCYVAIKQEPFSKIETDSIDSLKTEYEDIKTPSQRLRAILFRNYEKDSEGYKDFNSYYMSKMESLCNHFKNKLD